MIVYEATNSDDTRTFGTLGEAHEWCKSTCEGQFRGGCRIAQAIISVDKENILRLINVQGGTHHYTGRLWRLTSRGGLKPIEGDE